MGLKQGPLTQEELQAIWEGAVDKSFREPIVRAGEGNGFEAYTQMFAQLARTSLSIDRSTQAMYIRNFSGQTNEPASGERKAVVVLTFRRTGLLNQPLVLAKGTTFVGEETTDWGVDGGVIVITGRRYVLTDDVVFNPGDQGPFNVIAEAENVGWGYNNPLPGTISLISQPGTGFYHERATVKNAPPLPPALPPAPPGLVFLSTVNEADTFIPDHVGQYVRLTEGANLGQIARVISFDPPDLNVPRGSRVQLEQTGSIEAFGGIAGTFERGEQAVILSGVTVVAHIRILGETVVGAHKRVHFVWLDGSFAVGDTLLGITSLATANLDTVLSQTAFVDETPPLVGPGGASWLVLDWARDWDLTVTNELSPDGGRLGMLDALGHERNLPRLIGEADEIYRERIAEIADVVTPNAIRRVLNRVLGAIPWCFREVGSPMLPGIFYDRTGDVNGDFYDDDVIVWTGAMGGGSFNEDGNGQFIGFQERVEHRDSMGNVKSSGYFGRLTGAQTVFTMIRKAGKGDLAVGDVIVGLTSGAFFTPAVLVPITNPAHHRFHEYFDYADFRAYFLVGVPKMGIGEFGFAYDNHPRGAYDASPANDFYDGFPYGNAAIYKRVYDAVAKIKAGGTGFTLYEIQEPCI